VPIEQAFPDRFGAFTLFTSPAGAEHAVQHFRAIGCTFRMGNRWTGTTWTSRSERSRTIRFGVALWHARGPTPRSSSTPTLVEHSQESASAAPGLCEPRRGCGVSTRGIISPGRALGRSGRAKTACSGRGWGPQ
jgi:hypothetical protein